MKRLAISLGSLSLTLLNPGQCAPHDATDSASASIAEAPQSTSSGEELGEDELSFLEADPSELEKELLSLEEELEKQEKSEEEQFVADVLAEGQESKDIAISESPQNVEAQVSSELQQADPSLAEEDNSAMPQEQLTPLPEQEKTTAQLQNEEMDTNTSHLAFVEEGNKGSLTAAAFEEEGQEDLLVEEANAVSQADSTEEELADEGELSENDSTLSSSDGENSLDKELASEAVLQDSSIAEARELTVADSSADVTAPVKNTDSIEISFRQVFAGSPLIYGILLFLSIGAIAIWLYNYFAVRMHVSLTEAHLKNVRNKLVSNHFDEALSLCKGENNVFSKMMATGINSRKYGLQFMLESMKSEGKRVSVPFWQRLHLLQDIAIVAPMLGLLGTVLGMFYAFYDLNRSFESISTLFDGLGISVGTTVAGIFVAILAMVLQSMSKFRLVREVSKIENEALSLAHLIDSKHQGN